MADKPVIKIKNNAQKGSYRFSDILDDVVLQDVCYRITGRHEYTICFDDNSYNKGRLALIEYNDTITYVSFSEHGKVEGRNSFFQSLTTALISFYSDPHIKKRMAFYFLPSITGSFEGSYFRFMYRLMATNGVEFLNADLFLENTIIEFASIDDIIAIRSVNRERNTGNNSTYITRTVKDITQIYGKTYGASKKETTLLCLTAARLSKHVEMYEICEQNLSCLPVPDADAIKRMGNVEIIPTNRTMERKPFEADTNYLSPTFIYNLFQKFNLKECAFCECSIPEIIAGAHIWPVADIKRTDRMSEDEKWLSATDGENGLWLCHNHHKLFDEGLVSITNSGKIVYSNELNETNKSFIRKTTTKNSIPSFAFTDLFEKYLYLRTRSIAH